MGCARARRCVLDCRVHRAEPGLFCSLRTRSFLSSRLRRRGLFPGVLGAPSARAAHPPTALEYSISRLASSIRGRSRRFGASGPSCGSRAGRTPLTSTTTSWLSSRPGLGSAAYITSLAERLWWPPLGPCAGVRRRGCRHHSPGARPDLWRLDTTAFMTAIRPYVPR
jgi:hypothetical protein